MAFGSTDTTATVSLVGRRGVDITLSSRMEASNPSYVPVCHGSTRIVNIESKQLGDVSEPHKY
jgi:hypothetical protein